MIPTDPTFSATNECAPIALFAHRRAEHLNRLIDSLSTNALLQRSPLFVFCDGARHDQERDAVARTRAVAKERLGTRAQIFECETNRGLARSIISGVTELCQRYGRAIVFEDDLVLHPGCLEFMNAALDRYANEPRVYHVNAYRYPLPAAAGPSFTRLTSSWGWGTWARAWSQFEPDATRLDRQLRERKLIRALDFQGTFPYHRMLEAQIHGKVDSWAIRWYASVLLRGGLAISPNASQVNNRGFDNSGVHCGTTSKFDVELGDANYDWPSEVAEDTISLQQMRTFFRTVNGSFPRRVARRIKRILLTN